MKYVGVVEMFGFGKKRSLNKDKVTSKQILASFEEEKTGYQFHKKHNKGTIDIVQTEKIDEISIVTAQKTYYHTHYGVEGRSFEAVPRKRIPCSNHCKC